MYVIRKKRWEEDEEGNITNFKYINYILVIIDDKVENWKFLYHFISLFFFSLNI